MTNEHPEDARARRMAEVRALRGSPERLQQIADLEQQKRQTKSRSTSSASGRKTPENSSHMFGHPWPLWFQMRDVAYEYLCKCASERRMTSYGELWNAISSAIGEDLGSHWRQLPHLLGDVSEHTFTETGADPNRAGRLSGRGRRAGSWLLPDRRHAGSTCRGRVAPRGSRLAYD